MNSHGLSDQIMLAQKRAEGETPITNLLTFYQVDEIFDKNLRVCLTEKGDV